MKDDTKSSTFALLAGDDAFDPLEDGVRRRVRCFIEAILEEELQAALGRGRYERAAAGARGHRNGHRERQVIGTFGAETVKVPRARLIAEDDRFRALQGIDGSNDGRLDTLLAQGVLHQAIEIGRDDDADVAGAHQLSDRAMGAGRHLATFFAVLLGGLDIAVENGPALIRRRGKFLK